MHARTYGRLGTTLAGIAVSVMALSGVANAAARTISVPDGFVKGLSDTRATGHYEVTSTGGLHVYTEGATGTDKVAEYVATDVALKGVGEPSLDYTNTAGGLPGFQLVVDFNADGTDDGILVGEPAAYGNDWWLSNGSQQFVKDGAPSHTGGSGSDNHGTLDQWRAAFPTTVVHAFGFSLGSGVKGDGVINAINFAGDTYTFTQPVVLTSKDQCKNGGWATSTKPVFKNQGDCVSSFATAK
ncbi:hypothetical protein [Nocardioides rubriscoriae]|uniref:hypothetical protein n=1 Tax=Nocardioides rubriscoriae TaxID=642762 RepID=UPI0011DF4D74|nr:hypothetical protein [Nocardioides rubriscoriae]